LVGDLVQETQKVRLDAGTAEAFVFQAQASGNATNVHLYLDSGSQSMSLLVGVYSDSAGHPGTLLTAATLTNLTSSSWNTTSIISTPVVSGTIYWIAVLPLDGHLFIDDRFQDSVWTTWWASHGSYMAEVSLLANLSTLPTTWVTGTTPTDYDVSAYLTT